MQARNRRAVVSDFFIGTIAVKGVETLWIT